jgi:DNA polymerase-3 subunit alpha
MRRNGVALAGPDINHSEAEFTVERTAEGHAVRYALAGLRNVGEKAMDAIVAEREANGPFATLDDLFKRIPAGSMNRRQLEALAAAGALDGLEPNRAKIIANAELLMAVADEAVRSRTSGRAACSAAMGMTSPQRALSKPSRGAAPTRWRPSARTSVSISPPTRWRNIARWPAPMARAPMAA